MDASFRLKVASPCPADWDAMDGDERVRFCGKCERNVFNISSMTRSEAEELIEKSEGRVCGRFWVRDDGTVITADCPVGWRAKLARRTAWVGSMLAAAAGLLLTGLVGLRAGERQIPGFLGLHRLHQMLVPPAPPPTPPALMTFEMGDVAIVPNPPINPLCPKAGE